MVGDNIKATVKVDTDENDNFAYSKFEVYADIEDTHLQLTATSEIRHTPVYPTVPTSTISIDDVLSSWLALDFDELGDGPFFISDWPTWIGQSRYFQLIPSGSERIFATPPTFTLPPTNSFQSPQIRDPASYEPPFTGTQVGSECNVYPGTALHNQLVRKGICPTEANTRPGRGSLRN